MSGKMLWEESNSEEMGQLLQIWYSERISPKLRIIDLNQVKALEAFRKLVLKPKNTFEMNMSLR
jgi:hypothetical protein